MLHSISVDVEEYFHAANLQEVAPAASWYRLPMRVVTNTERILEIFALHNIRATFFVLGYIARRYPELVRKIFAAGHEVASHGYSHQMAFAQTPKQFLRDVKRAKALLEDITGTPVLGYRAPNFSILPDNNWAYEALLRAGYVYDSSLYPTWHPRYSNNRESVHAKTLSFPHLSKSLFIFPLAVWKTPLGLRLPAAGGAYWRLLPRWYCSSVLHAIERFDARAFHCYFHPWELDTEQPVFTSLSPLQTLRHYGGARNFEKRLSFFLKSFPFGPIKEVGVEVFGNDFSSAIGEVNVSLPGREITPSTLNSE